MAISFAEAATKLSEITLLEGKNISLDDEITSTQAQIDNNKKEIEKRANLEATNLGLEAKIKTLKREFKSSKGEMDKRILEMSESGYPLPPKRDNGAKGSVSM